MTIYELLKKKFPNHRYEYLMETAELILSLLDENREGVSDASQESGVSHAVRERHAECPNGEVSEASVAGALGKRIDDENLTFVQGDCRCGFSSEDEDEFNEHVRGGCQMKSFP